MILFFRKDYFWLFQPLLGWKQNQYTDIPIDLFLVYNSDKYLKIYITVACFLLLLL